MQIGLSDVSLKRVINDVPEIVLLSNKTESFKLHISEGVLLDERLEEIASSTYATDSAQDIANWIVNKPKPYRVIYDKTYEILSL